MLRKSLLSFLLLFTCSMLWSQVKKISGTVSDAVTGETLIGASVVETKTNNGIASDFDGRYVLEIKGTSLTVSYVGYKDQILTVTESGEVNIKLQPDNSLETSIVVGYTTQKKREVLGAVSNIKSKELSQLPVSGASEALQGRVAGVQVSGNSGAPGAGVSVRIRGTGSLNSTNDPLYIVDGIPVTDALSSIAPNDIENISVLKDASSAAIYGSRANNGVVLITTKRGKSGKPKINYHGQTGFQAHGSLTDMVNTNEYVNIYNVAAQNDGRELIPTEVLGQLADVNHLKEIFRVAPINIHEVSVSGEKNKLNYLASTSYYNQNGIIQNSDYNRLIGRANLSYKAMPWLDLGLNISGGRSNTGSVPSSGDGYGSDEGGSVVRYAFLRNPAIPVYDQNGNLVDKPSEFFGDQRFDAYFGDGYNPVGVAKMADRKRTDDYLLTKVSATLKLPYDIIWNNNFGVDYKNGEYKVNNHTWGTNDRINNPATSSLAKNRSTGWTFNSVFNNTVSLNEVHRINSMVGTEIIRYNGKDENFGYSPLGDTEYASKWAHSLVSFFGKVDYNYDYKYYVSALVRQDGSSRFTKGNRWGTFYSVSGGWDIHQEEFMKSLTFINLLKLRTGWGVVGNQDAELYAYSDKFTPYANYPFGGHPSTGYTQSKLGNNKLTWETSSQFNVGIDMSFLKGQVGFSLDYFNKITRDMLVRAPLPPSLGNASPYWINSGKIQNKGIEVEVFYRKQFKDGGFSATVNWGYLKNEVLELDAPIQAGRVDNEIYAKYIEKGYSVGSFYLYEMDGIFQNEREVVKSAYQGTGIAPGDVRYTDLNGDGVINQDDRKHVGNSMPSHTLGINLEGNWKNFDLTLFFQGAFGHKIYSQISHETEGFYRGFPVTREYYQNYWRGEGTSNVHPRPSWSAKGNNVIASTRFLENASYLRLKNIQLGYTIPLKSKIVSSLRVYTAATNLLTFTAFSGLDPEMTVSANSRGEGDKANGIDWGTYPVAKTYMLGVNLTF